MNSKKKLKGNTKGKSQNKLIKKVLKEIWTQNKKIKNHKWNNQLSFLTK